jgi:hypothetical protein
VPDTAFRTLVDTQQAEVRVRPYRGTGDECLGRLGIEFAHHLDDRDQAPTQEQKVRQKCPLAFCVRRYSCLATGAAPSSSSSASKPTGDAEALCQ